CWQSLAEEKENRVLPLVGLWLSLAAAVACHYYSVLIPMAFALGEVARTLRRSKIDLLVWAVLVLSLAPLLPCLPLIGSARAYSGAFWARPKWGDLFDFYYFLLRSAEVPSAAALVLVVVSQAVFPAEDREPTGVSAGLLRHEVALAVGFLIIPLVAVALAMFLIGAFTERYALSAVLGLGVLMPFAFQQLIRNRPILTLLVLVILASGFSRRSGIMLQESSVTAQDREAVIK